MARLEELEVAEQSAKLERDSVGSEVTDVKRLLGGLRTDLESVRRSLLEVRDSVDTLHAILPGPISPTLAGLDQRVAKVERSAQRLALLLEGTEKLLGDTDVGLKGVMERLSDLELQLYEVDIAIDDARRRVAFDRFPMPPGFAPPDGLDDLFQKSRAAYLRCETDSEACDLARIYLHLLSMRSVPGPRWLWANLKAAELSEDEELIDHARTHYQAIVFREASDQSIRTCAANKVLTIAGAECGQALKGFPLDLRKHLRCPPAGASDCSYTEDQHVD